MLGEYGGVGIFEKALGAHKMLHVLTVLVAVADWRADGPKSKMTVY